MSNVLEYILNLKDGISDKINKISATSEKATSKMQKLEKQTLDNTKAFDKAGKSAEGFKSKMSNALSAIPGADFLTNPYLLAATAIGVAGKASMSFDEGMAKINTTAQLTNPQLEQLRDNIIDIGVEQGAKNLYALPEAYEKIISQTGDVIQSQEILKSSIKGSKAGFTDQSVVADALAQSLSLIGKENANAQEVLDTFFAAKRVGAGEFKDFANYMPNLIASGKALGITYKDVAGQFAYMTGKGFAAEKSATLLENAYTALGKSDIQKGLKNAGVNIFDEKGAMRSFDKIFPELQKKLAGMSDNKKSNFLESIGLRDAQAKSAFMALSSDSAKLKESLNATNNSAGETEKAFEKAQNPMMKIQKLWTSMQYVGLKLGDVIGFVISPALDGLNFIVDSGINFLRGWRDGLVEGKFWIMLVTGAITALSTGIAVQWAWTKKAIVEQKIKATWDSIMALKTMGWAGAQAYLNGLLIANPVGVIVTAIVALIAIIGAAIYYYDQWGAAILQFLGPIGWMINAFKAVYDHWESIKKAFQTDGIIGGLKRLGIVLMDALLKPLQQILDLASNLPGIIGKSAAEARDKVQKFRESQDLVLKSETEKKKPLGEVLFGGLKSMIKLPTGGGIAPPTVPGANLDNSPIGGDGKGGKGSKSKVNESIATGGQKHNYITINLKDLIGVLNISGKDFKDSSNQMQQQTEDALMRVLAMATTAGI